MKIMGNVSTAQMPVSNNEPAETALAADWLAAKAAEDSAKKQRIEIEGCLLPLVERHESASGSKTTTVVGFKVTVKDEMKAKCTNYEALVEICAKHGIAGDAVPIKWSPEISVKALDAIRADNAAAYAEIASVIERYAAKPSFSIKATA
jgi:hypothetical protein